MSASPLISLDAIKMERMTRFNPLPGMKPAKLTRQIQEFRSGRLRELTQTISAIAETDDTLISAWPKAKNAVARHGYEILKVETDEVDENEAELHREALLAFYNNLTARDAMEQDDEGGMSLLVRQLMDAKLHRYSCHNLVWQRKGGFYTAEFWRTPLTFFENSLGKMRFIGTPFGYDGEEMKRGAWLVNVGQGIGIAAACAWMFKKIPLNDWLVYCARHGMPGIEGVTDAAEGSDEWKKMVAAVRAAGREFAWVRSTTSHINIVDFKGQGELPYPKIVDRMDRALLTMCRGGDLGGMSKNEGTGASLQGDERSAIEQDDAMWISETLNTKIDRLVIEYTFGEGVAPLAYFKLKTENKKNIDQELKVDEFLIENGFPRTKQSIGELYGRQMVDGAKEEDLMKAPAKVAPMESGALPQQKKEKKAANDARSAAAGKLGVDPGWLEPLRPWFESMEAKGKAGDELSDADFLDGYEQALMKLPELFADMDLDVFIDEMAAGMGTAVLKGIKNNLAGKVGK